MTEKILLSSENNLKFAAPLFHPLLNISLYHEKSDDATAEVVWQRKLPRHQARIEEPDPLLPSADFLFAAKHIALRNVHFHGGCPFYMPDGEQRDS
jgi:hypothetical protein